MNPKVVTPDEVAPYPPHWLPNPPFYLDHIDPPMNVLSHRLTLDATAVTTCTIIALLFRKKETIYSTCTYFDSFCSSNASFE